MPTEICGVDIEDPDQEILCLESIARDGIDPRIPGLAMRAIPTDKSKQVLVIRVPRSWAAPHMIKYQDWSRFYSRHSNGKYKLDIGEIRAAFALSEAAADRIRRFRTDRLATIMASETPVVLEKSAKVVLHIVPVNAFNTSTTLSEAALESQARYLQPIYGGIKDSRYNFDGFVACQSYGYVQLFRSGCIEAVDAGLLRRQSGLSHYPTGKLISSVAFGEDIFNALGQHLTALKNLGVEPPLFVMLSLLGVAGYVMGVSPERYAFDEKQPIDRENLILPEIVVDEYGVEPATLLRPAFDAVWNACGWPGSINYDKSGKWVRH